MNKKGFTPLEIRSLTGFTLIELVIILSILGILSVAFTPVVVGAMRRSQLNACAEQLASHIRYCRSVAMASDHDHEIQFTNNNPDPGEHSYMCRDVIAGAVVPDPLDQTRTLNVVLRGSGARPEFKGITFGTINIPGASTIRFNDGSDPESNGGTTVGMSSTASAQLTNQSGEIRTIYVAVNTGVVFMREP